MELKKTVTSIFIVPTLKIDRDALRDNNFINGYIRDYNIDIQYENAVYLLFRPDNLNLFQRFVEYEYDRTVSIIDDYDYDGGFVVLVYMLDLMFKDDFDLIKKGKYSKTSQHFQDLFPKVIKIYKNGLHRDELSLQHRVFKKADDLKEYWESKINMDFDDNMEVWQGFDMEAETLYIEKIKDLI